MTSSPFELWFAERFGVEPPWLGADALVYRLDHTLWSDRDDVELPPRLRMTAERPAHPGPYTIAGAWGHGLDAHAFYYVARDAKRDVFLRLKHGGAYQDSARAGLEVVEALRGLARWCARFEPWLVSLHVTMDLHRFEAQATLQASGRPRRIALDGDELRPSPHEPAPVGAALFAELDVRAEAALAAT